MPSKVFTSSCFIKRSLLKFTLIRFWNQNAKMRNLKVYNATGALAVMQSIERGPNPRVPIGQPIPNFPGTPDQISQMNGTFPLLVLHFFCAHKINNNYT